MAAKAYDGDIPANYDARLGAVLFLPFADEVARRTVLLRPRDVLEIAAGSGVGTRKLRDYLAASANLTATDISADMLNVACAKFTNDERISFDIADACALPFSDGSYDVIVGQFGYMFYPDKPKAMQEALRALRPGGSYLLTVWDAGHHNPWGPVCLDVLKDFFPQNPPMWLNEPFSCADIDPIKEGLIASGFGDVVVSVLKRSRKFDAVDFASGVVFGSPVIGEIAERGGVDPNEVVRACAEALTRAVGQILPVQAILFEARKPG